MLQFRRSTILWMLWVKGVLLYIKAFVSSEKVLENFSRGPGKVLDFFPVKEWEPCPAVTAVFLPSPLPCRTLGSSICFSSASLGISCGGESWIDCLSSCCHKFSLHASQRLEDSQVLRGSYLVSGGPVNVRKSCIWNGEKAGKLSAHCQSISYLPMIYYPIFMLFFVLDVW